MRGGLVLGPPRMPAVDSVDFGDSAPAEAPIHSPMVPEEAKPTRADDVAAAVANDHETVANGVEFDYETGYNRATGKPWRTGEGPYAEGGAWAKYEELKSRCFTIMQYEEHPDTGETLITRERVEAGAAKCGVRDKVTYVRHDKDTYGEDDVEKNPRAVLGALKGVHWHIVELRGNAASVAAVARKYVVNPDRVRMHHQAEFFDRVEYNTHESKTQQAKGKFRYPDEEVHANFDWRAELDEHKANRGKSKGGKVTAEDVLAMKIQEEGLTLRQAKALDPLAFSRNKSRMVSCRSTYLETAPLPPYRMNYYMCGPSGAGKSETALMLARVIASVYYPDLSVEEAVFVVGRKGVEFQKYDGQPILVWDDYRVLSLINAFGGSRDALWPAFDISPKPLDVNRKYGSIRLANAFNIITGVTPYMEFLDNLAGEYEFKGEKHEAEDKNQAFRRVLFVTELTLDTLKVYFNRGIVGTGTYQQYEHYATLLTSMKHHAETMQALENEGQRDEYRLAVGQQVLSPMIDAHADVKPKRSLTVDEAIEIGLAGSQVLTGDALAAHETEVAIEAAESAAVERAERELDRIALVEARQLCKQFCGLDGKPHSPWGDACLFGA